MKRKHVGVDVFESLVPTHSRYENSKNSNRLSTKAGKAKNDGKKLCSKPNHGPNDLFPDFFLFFSRILSRASKYLANIPKPEILTRNFSTFFSPPLIKSNVETKKRCHIA